MNLYRPKFIPEPGDISKISVQMKDIHGAIPHHYLAEERKIFNINIKEKKL